MKDLTEIASISGKGGLFRIIKPGRVGVILESMDDKKIKIATNPNHKVSILADISIYTTTDDGAMPLEDIFRKIHKEFGDDPGIDGKSTADELISFIEYIVPEYDNSRVYPSDVKKLVNWYNVLLREFPDFFKEEKKEKKKDKKTSTGQEQELNDQEKDGKPDQDKKPSEDKASNSQKKGNARNSNSKKTPNTKKK